MWEMKVKRRRQKAVDREECVIKEAKTVREPQSQGVSKQYK
jgi:hypothetical protein